MLPTSRPALLLLFALALAAAIWRIPAPPTLAFSPPPPATSTLPSQFSAELPGRSDSQAGYPTLTQLPDGRLAAAWLAVRDGENVIRFSILDRDGWREPRVIASRQSTAGGTFAYIGDLGQPVLHAEGSWLHLWYVSRTLGSSINHSLSTDGGRSWSKPRRLQTSPLANLGSEVQAPPVPLADGGLALPASLKLLGLRGEILHLSPTGRILGKTRLPAHAAWQPAVLALDTQRAVALLRDANAGHVRMSSTDNGTRWQENGAMPMPNLDTPLAALRLRSGRLLLAGNGADGRQSLQLWLSADEGRNWQASRTIESAADGGAEFSDPALLLDRDGRIHLAYAWRRQGIRYAHFSEAWLDEGQR
ncbi:MAG: exo-alpha-sialidase [Azonexus sp.]|jgi:predicted neuraminidase|nr:exo-alpha-sialidase [Azonexus sp.]